MIRSFFGRKVCLKIAIIAAQSRLGKRGRTGIIADRTLPASALLSSAVRSTQAHLQDPSPLEKDADILEITEACWSSEREFYIYSGG